ncbi:MAG: peptidylprolyl isomerase [Planctomycetes bacterium]|nr:peptidylprolyl isomerase [Planctomycetota bacterium]
MTVRGALVVVLLLALGCGAPVAPSGGAAITPGRVPQEPQPARVAPTSDDDAGALAEAVAGLSAVGDDVLRVRASLDALGTQAGQLDELLGRAARVVPGPGDDGARADQAQALEGRLAALRRRRDVVETRLSTVEGYVESVLDYVREGGGGRAEDVAWVRRRAERHAQELQSVETELDALFVDAGRISEDVDALGVKSDAALASAEPARDAALPAASVEASDAGSVRTAAAATRDPSSARADDGQAVSAATPRASEDVLELVTSQGTLLIELYDELAPRNTANFRQLVRQGFYDGLTFHRVIPDYLVQGGDPLGTGLGGAGREVRAEFGEVAFRRGTVAMARMAHPDTASSQFFITLRRVPELDGKYTVIGQVIRGDKVLDAIAALGTPSGRPVEPVPTIVKATLRPRRPDDAGPIADARGR